MLKTTRNVCRKVTAIFISHPRACGETYFQHLKIAGAYGIKFVLTGIACLIHSVLPFLFVTTASKTVEEVNAHLSKRKTPTSPEPFEQSSFGHRIVNQVDENHS